MSRATVTVSIIVPVVNKLAFTRQCLDRIARHASDTHPFEVIIVDNGSTDGTEAFFRTRTDHAYPLVYERNSTNLGFAGANNIGAGLSQAKYLLFLNNDTIVQPRWLDAMIDLAEGDARIGVVGIKQLFPYTNLIHHTGIVFTADRKPVHLYPHVDASLPHVNKQREYQAVTGSCLLIGRDLFCECGMFDEAYRNGYEDIDLCLTVRKRGRSIVCCTSAFIYHYGQISETRTDDDDQNASRFMAKWGREIKPDELHYFQQDRKDVERAEHAAARPSARRAAPDLLYFADDLSSGSALTWATSELVIALQSIGAPVAIKHVTLPSALERHKRTSLQTAMLANQPLGGTQIRWSHYWPQHLRLELTGRLNLELFVINYLFGSTTRQPWDYWLQCLTQNRYGKLPLSTFSRDVLVQAGVAADACQIVRPGYSPEIDHVAAPATRSGKFRLLTVTNSHDLERYGTQLVLEAYWRAFSAQDEVVLVIKDYGAGSGDTTLRDLLRRHKHGAAVEFVTEFTSKERLIELYKSCDVFVSAHRGEGYGMKILDALACGLPVITPLFGGPTDFCTPSNCFPVEFALGPVGDCLDTRTLRITNSPLWAEPDVDSLMSQMRRVVSDPDAARRVGAHAREDVAGLTWTNTARQFLAAVAALDGGAGAPGKTTMVPLPPAKSAERSPYWLGRRISVVVPTFNRQRSLFKCLDALERQSILPQEFEVVVVDDGSTDGTGEALAAREYPFDLKYCFQTNRGPGAARNEGVQRADGEILLFLGDDIIAEETLLEEHLIAHAGRRAPETAILGHIDWPSDLRRSAVMDFVCGDSSLQFAYQFIPKLKSLDYRFFYTSNISLKRSFLLDAAADGVVFDPCFAHAAFEDSELAIRLERRGLTIEYCDKALAYHDHWMDLESFSRREYNVGKMAVVFYRKHPQLDEQLQVRWIGQWATTVETVKENPELNERLRALDADTDTFLRSLARSLEELLGLQGVLKSELFGSKLSPGGLTSALHSVLAVIFDVERTRGKVEEWYASVDDPLAVDTAKRLLGCMRKVEFFGTNPREIQKLEGTINWLNHHVMGELRRRIADLEHQLGSGLRGRLGLRALDRTLIRAARRADYFVQRQLGRDQDGRWLERYQSVRGQLKRLLRPPRQSAH